jgi:hypothetical protein
MLNIFFVFYGDKGPCSENKSSNKSDIEREIRHQRRREVNERRKVDLESGFQLNYLFKR